jgi:hypothetical protein
MTQSLPQGDEQVRKRLRLVAAKYHLEPAKVDMLSTEEIMEALHQLEVGFLPIRLMPRVPSSPGR